MKRTQMATMFFLFVTAGALHAGPFIKRLTNNMPEQKYGYAVTGVCSVDFALETAGKPQDLFCDLSKGNFEIFLNRGLSYSYTVKMGSSADIEVNVKSPIEKSFGWDPKYKDVPVGAYIETEWTDEKGKKFGGFKGGRNFVFHSMKESGNYHLILNADGTVALEEL